METIQSVIYRASAKVTGGREGSGVGYSPDIELKFSTPKELGGAGGAGTNPEQLFAAGYAACFTGAFKLVASQNKVTVPSDMTIEGTVGIGAISHGFGVEVELKISVPGLERSVVQGLVDKAHQICPYSNATRGNINVTLIVV